MRPPEPDPLDPTADLDVAAHFPPDLSLIWGAVGDWTEATTHITDAVDHRGGLPAALFTVLAWAQREHVDLDELLRQTLAHADWRLTTVPGKDT